MNDVKISPKALDASTRDRPHLGVLLQRVRRAIDDEVSQRIAQAGFDNIRPGHGTVFTFLPLNGARLTELAARARMTKQAMGELVRELEVLGYVERAPDPDDGRARIIRFTAKGRRADEVGILAIRDIEGEWAGAVGREQMDSLRSTLMSLLRSIDVRSERDGRRP
jgi:DNA-binding MarR family transcriptional regulator